MYLFRAVDAHGQTVDFYLSETRDREAAKLFLKRHWPTWITDPRMYSPETDCGAIRRRFGNYKPPARWRDPAGSERAAIAITELNPIIAM